MSAVVGIDVSTRALDLVKLDESSNRAVWVRCELEGKDAWERTLAIGTHVRAIGPNDDACWWDDVYLVAIEEPRGRGQLRTNAVLNRVVGAVAASLPARLRVPERCWLVRPDEWRDGLGLKHNAKPYASDLETLAPGFDVSFPREAMTWTDDVWQNCRDAYCVALWARGEIAKGVAA